ncbi:ribonuclease HII [Kineococcus sp. R8]|uniref:ribonuclease HII n=1 Tax=Kineococcus siccus TaxID=2696567 RepID=UPI0014131009|nr:ribonuclease HII [Kineococcus siccus]NAZ83612.1 ribonuclease HII [Kineococcus siccus]
MSPQRTSRPPARSPQLPPTLRHERQLLRAGHDLVAGMDEVGRGSLAGPVTVGVLLVGPDTRTAPAGLRDSKLLTPAAREDLAPRVRRWAVAWGVGHAEPAEIDAVGIIAALRLAGRRALAQLPRQPSVLILDGSHDWLSDPREPSLLDLVEDAAVPVLPCDAPAVTTRVKADMSCAAVAGASVLAKTTRDAIMVQRHEDHPVYGWAGNKGYSAPDHLEALARHGTCPQHRRSWRLPGVGDARVDARSGDHAGTALPVPRDAEAQADLAAGAAATSVLDLRASDDAWARQA